MSHAFQTFRGILNASPSRAEREAGCEALPIHGKDSAYGDGLNSATKVRTAIQAVDGVDRGGIRNKHPTVKSVALMRWLCRLVTPPGGIVLDPFCGSGSTGVACVAEGFRFIGVERELESVAIARARIAHALTVEQDTAPLLKYAGVDRVEKRDEPPPQISLFGEVGDRPRKDER